MTLGVQPVPDQAEQPVDRPTGPSTRLTTLLSLTCLVVVMLRVTLHAASPLDNGDTWFHLSIGKHLLDDWSLRSPGQLSSFATSPWTPTQWSTEMVAAKMADWFGLPGVAWLFGAVYLGFIVAVYAACRRVAGPLPATVAAGMAVIAATSSLSARPQVISLIFLVVVVAAWLAAHRSLRVPWHLVPLTWVWATAHGLWSAGVIVSVVCCVGLALDGRLNRRSVLRMFSVPALCLVAACLTPVGPRLLSTQLAVGERAPLIGEWAATSFRTMPAFVVATMAAVIVMRWARRARVPWTHLLLLLLGCGWAALVSRMVSVGGVLLAPLLAIALQELVESRTPRRRPSAAEWTAVGAAVTVCLVGLAVAVPRTAAEPEKVPAGFSDRLAALQPGSAVAVEDATGAWVEWRFPDLNPVIDGMLDAYPVDYIARFDDFQVVKPGWQEFLDESGARVAVLLKGSSLTAAVEDQLGWRVVDTDGQWVYLVAPDIGP